MATVDAENRQNETERKWIRLQEIGLLQLLAIPIVIIIAACFTGFTARGASAAFMTNFIVLTVFFLSISGFICLKIGDEKRVELRDKETNAQNTHFEQ